MYLLGTLLLVLVWRKSTLIEATVEIAVRDVNDVVPTLDQTEYLVVIQENSVPGSVIAQV